jgi:AraC-like DNA-binding protein
MLFGGAMAKDCYTLVFVTDCERKGRSFNFATEHHDGYMGLFAPGGILDAYTPEGYANATLTIPVPVFLAAVERLFPEIPDRILREGAGMRINSPEQMGLRSLLNSTANAIKDSSGALIGQKERKALESDLLDTFILALRAGCDSLIPSPGMRMKGRFARLRQARDYIADHVHEPIALADLCNELGLSRRGVEFLFQDSMGIGPAAFIRHQRLHGVRRALLASPRAAGAVKESALQWGFWHMGHFSQEYRSLFGEPPSATATRHA